MAKSIATDGTIQDHTFHDFGDTDWVQFSVAPDDIFEVNVEVPLDSPVDIELESYQQCNAPVLQRPQYPFGTGTHMRVVVPPTATTSTYYFKLTNLDPNYFGNTASYKISIRKLEVGNATAGGVLIIAGRRDLIDPVLPNIYSVTNDVYRTYRTKGWSDEQIYYLATDPTLDPRLRSISYVDGSPTKATVQNAITVWAKTHVSADKALTLYLMGHGENGKFYLDNTIGETLSPADLDQWLDALETEIPGLKVNIIIDACNAGSFITMNGSISKDEPNRVVVASAKMDQDAWSSSNGAEFSDRFLAALRENLSVALAFERTSDELWQTPWIDDNGNGIPNEPEDGKEAARRGFGFAGTFGHEVWRPYIPELTILPPVNGEVTIETSVENDYDQDSISQVVAVLYPPSFTPPTVATGELVDTSQLTQINLTEVSPGRYQAKTVLPEMGSYKIVVYAKDADGALSNPKTVNFINGTVPTGVGLNRMETKSVSIWSGVVLLGGISAVLLYNRRRA